MIELQPFVNVKNVQKTPAEEKRVEDRYMKEVSQEETAVRDSGSWR